MRRFWIDTDTASDDAVAIIMALRTSGIQVEGISTVSGNVPVGQGTRNALNTVELCAAHVPVYVGLDRPLLREPSYATFFHGEDGLGGMNLPAPRQKPEALHAVDALINAIHAAPGEVTLVTLGPLTNIALALRRAPEIAQQVREVYVMGGNANTVGNITPAAEFNIWVDPEAARMVFFSGLPILMVGWEHCCGQAVLNDAEMAYVRSLDTPYAHYTLDTNRTAIQVAREWLGLGGLPLPDPVTMAVAIDRSICTCAGRYYVEVETASELTRGMTVVDSRRVTNKEPNIEVCWAIDVARWKEALYRTLR